MQYSGIMCPRDVCSARERHVQVHKLVPGYGYTLMRPERIRPYPVTSLQRQEERDRDAREENLRDGGTPPHIRKNRGI